MSRSLDHAFTVSVPTRLAWALGFTIATVILVRWVESAALPPSPPAATITHTSSASPLPADFAITVQATYPVATWTVLADGCALVATSSDERHWRGTCPAQAQELAVEAAPSDALASGPAALRVTLSRAGTSRQHDAWGDGATGLRLSLSQPGVVP